DDENTNSLVTIEVHKFQDNNGDGLRNGADADIAWNFTITVGATDYHVTTGTAQDFGYDDKGTADTSDDTGAKWDGHVLTVADAAAALDAGIAWSVTEADVAGWTHTTASSATGTLNTANSSADATTNSDLDFGNFKNVDICGYKWEDTNGNGVW